MRLTGILAVSLVLLAAVSAQATYVYSVDDGTSETGLVDNHADAILINGFTAQPGNERISAIQISIGWPTFNEHLLGHGITLAIWSDGVSQDGNPTDATLLSSWTTTVHDICTTTTGDVWATYTAPAPVDVSGKFFVGYMLSVVDADGVGNVWNSMNVARGDTTAPQHQSWLAEAPNGTGASYFSNLGSSGMLTPVMNMDDLVPAGFPAQNFMIQAVGGPVPEPVTMTLVGLGIAGLGGYIRRRIAK